MSLVVGDKLTLTIDDVAFGGEGVGRFDNFVVFIPFVAPGEVVEAELTEVKKRFARGKLTKVLKPAAIRVEPLCPYFGECGGCQYQHLEYPAQLKLKHKQLQDLFERVGHLDRCVIDPVVPCPQPYHYRNRIMVRSQWNKPRQRLDVGFIRADNRLVVDVEECKIAEPGLNRQLLEVRANPPPRGGLKVVLRIPPEGWQVPPDSFFQNNFFLLPKLLEAVRDRVLGSGSKYLIDVYCGVGLFSIELAGQVTSFAGVEIDRMAIESARKNAEARGCTNGEFLIGQAEELIPELLIRFPPSETTVVLDPPRKGCAPPMLEALRRNRPGQVIYISCNPATMARDLNILCAEGVFELAQVTPLDMFPHTQHVECVADLRCRQQPGAPG